MKKISRISPTRNNQLTEFQIFEKNVESINNATLFRGVIVCGVAAAAAFLYLYGVASFLEYINDPEFINQVSSTFLNTFNGG